MKEKKLTPPNWTLTTMDKTLPVEKLRHISVFDMILGDTTNDPEILESTVSGEASCNIALDSAPKDIASLLRLLRSKPRLWDEYFWNMAEYKEMSSEHEALITDDQLRVSFLDWYQKRLFRVLNDSVSKLTILQINSSS
jgi:hypothetical protein